MLPNQWDLPHAARIFEFLISNVQFINWRTVDTLI